MKVRKRGEKEAVTLPQATRRFARQVKITVAILSVVFIAALVVITYIGFQNYGDGFSKWFRKDGWTMASFCSAYYEDWWLPATAKQGEETFLTLAELADHIQHYTAARFGLDTFFVQIYDVNGNPVVSSDSYENQFYDYRKAACEFAGQMVGPQYHPLPAENGHSHYVAYDRSVSFDPARREERASLPFWFKRLYRLADGDAFMQKATALAAVKPLLKEQDEWERERNVDCIRFSDGRWESWARGAP